MSREMVLVPLVEWKRLKETSRMSTTAAEASDPSQTITEIQEESPKELNQENDIIDLLPKTYRSRAKIILHYLFPYLNSDKRVVFADGSIGAHVIDYLRFVLNSIKTHAPPDIGSFMTLLETLGVPDSVYKKHSVVIPKKSDAVWLTFE